MGISPIFSINGDFSAAAEACRAQAIGCDRGRGVCRPLPSHCLPGWVTGEDGLLRGFYTLPHNQLVGLCYLPPPLVPLAHSFAKIPDMFTKSRTATAALSLLPLLASLVPGVASQQSW